MTVFDDDIKCAYCHRQPHEIDEYLPGSDQEVDDGERAWVEGDFASPAAYVRSEEGTYNSENGHFACTDCYVKIGCPSLPAPGGWVAP